MAAQLCTATAGDVRVGIPTDDVRELVRDRDVTPIPLTTAALRGLMNLRGELVVVLDLRVRLGRPAHPDPGRAVHVVLRGEPLRSLLVDTIGGITPVSDDRRVTVPSNLDPAVRALVADAVVADREVVLRLDVARAAEIPSVASDGVQPRDRPPVGATAAATDAAPDDRSRTDEEHRP